MLLVKILSPLPQLTSSYTGAAAYNSTTFDPPALPDPLPSLSLDLNIQTNPSGLSITQSGAFMGFSVEMSVANQVCESILQVPFLNLLATILQRSGTVRVRIGGNSQDTASQVASLDDGKVLEKDLSGVTNPTETPPLAFTPDLMYMMRNISNFVNVRWFVGIPFNDSSNFRLEIAQSAQEILGYYRIGNEPDLYAAHGHRSSSYSQYDYVGELGSVIDDMSQYSDLSCLSVVLLIGATSKLMTDNFLNNTAGTWTPEDVWDTGVMDTYGSNIAWMSVEHYPTDNCYVQYGTGTPRNDTELWPTYLMHTTAQSLIQPYLNSTAYAQSKSKPFIMFETNTASCAPPTNQSSYKQWTVGPVFYSSLVIAEAVGPSNQSQVLEIGAENQSTNYVSYENVQPVRMYTENIAIGGSQTGQSNTTPSQVKELRYLTALSVFQKGNYSWASQTFGGNFESDGRLERTKIIETIPFSVLAPGAALVFLTDDLTETEGAPSTTFATTTKTATTATVDTSVLATSNGCSGNSPMGSSGKGSANDGVGLKAV
ncbi:glycoside hydrolase family 79 protein [Lentinula detonsa]|uniref:Glycoside hydrolase family 79 protein n=1 Tax=Lentinula detonsa TaxID=2804962 RepID=A0A9W8U4C3_9AGAR|nr:glycoside hydrolase family 79 protein [Lentinula detonsa]